MNPIRRIRRIRRIAAVLAGLAAGLVAFGVTPAFARIVPPPDVPIITGGLAPAPPVQPATTVTRTVLVGGMPGWQIALIAAGAALLAAAVAVLAYRALAGRRKTVTAAA